MPVPVPRISEPAAHPVVKQKNCGDGQTNPFRTLTRTLPGSPTGPPPSFGTREQWINSLPTWRRTKPRRIWEDDTRPADPRVAQDFYRGLTAAANASVIKGAPAEACIPPLFTLLASGQPPADMPTDHHPGSNGDADDEMDSDDYSAMDQSHLENQSQWSATSPMGSDDDEMAQHASANSVAQIMTDLEYDERAYERGAFTPVFEDLSPGTASGPERGSSPLPMTPFGVYVDRAVASQPYAAHEGAFSNNVASYSYEDQRCGPHCYPVDSGYQVAAEQPRGPAPAPVPEIVTPSATTSYKKLAEPLSEWVANYVWKACTTGHSLPPMFARPSNHSVTVYANMPPSYLAASIHSLLLSTLLQPSAVFLALWYIVQLPVYFSAAPLGPENAKEARFRAALLGDPYTGLDKDAIEASAPFRLVVLGCMLANKWLDDHTFSNKTWHNISNVPIQALNKLESLTLDIFAYDLTISSRDWSQWLSHVLSYHMSLASPTNRPQPISRPSTNPHSIVRKAIEEMIQAPVACDAFSVPQPVFVGIEERKREKLEKERAMVADVLEIDLDEDGPLREEYLPKRRVSGAGSYRNSQVIQPLNVVDNVAASGDWEQRGNRDMGRSLPPPAKWSPSGDEPIHRERTRVSGQYVAVQAPIVTYPAPYHPVDAYAHHSWSSVTYPPVKPMQPTYIFDFPVAGNQATYNSYPYVPQPISHSRSHSLSYDQENLQSRNHMRSYSQSRFEYQCSDIRMTANEFVPHSQGDAAWMGASHYQYHGSAFAPIHNVNYHQPAWLRT
ncbi:hypothetical protein DXG03_003513 [Asterophora parasitica]|uniref:Cyclin n=1 Tax=Asterophora parasitica TaxID=117018 RepID=A0A9P7GAH4_9AGAR|nr:hypothetical protein DXG03_003513 [Asterophora parasitica]